MGKSIGNYPALKINPLLPLINLDVPFFKSPKRLSIEFMASEVVRKDDDDSLNTFSIGQAPTTLILSG